MSWDPSRAATPPRGATLLRDGPAATDPAIAIARVALRTNSRIGPVRALYLAHLVVAAARRNGVPAEVLAALLLQESAFDPGAVSPAAAMGVAQFEISTADDVGARPFDVVSAIDASSVLLSDYLRRFASYASPLSCALAAYNAGPYAVIRYRGVPPYAETREYVDDIFDRRARIASFERRVSASPSST